jgi:N-hydroxyarylamine O-acetyltransferase
MLTFEQIRAYLARIGMGEVVRADDQTLAALQYAHLQTVPYENLDILAGKAISLKLDDIFEKIVTKHRGGFCFELNRLFGALLAALGYEVTDYVARYWRGETSIPLRRHQVLRVKTCENHEFLCDVGVGAPIPLWPVPYVVGEVCDQAGICYALREDPTFGKVLTELHIFPHGKHGASLCSELTGKSLVIPEAQQWPELAARFLKDAMPGALPLDPA